MKLYTILNTREVSNDLGECQFLFVDDNHRRDYIEQNYNADEIDQLGLDSEWKEPKELLNEFNELVENYQRLQKDLESKRKTIGRLQKSLEEAERLAKGPELYKISRDGENRIVESWDEVLNEVSANKGRTLQITPVEMSDIINFYLENVE